MMTEFLLALILAGAGLHISLGAEKQEKHSDVKYKGPVVYTNLPPPVLYFPNFPEKPKLSNRGSSGDTEDKRVEYVPFPYKDLPLLIYQSGNQPPVHVIEKNPNSEKDDSGAPQSGPGYQTGPALYRVAESGQYDHEEADSTNRPQGGSGEKFINVGLSTSQVPPIDPSNPQYISIGVTAVQPQSSDVHSQSSAHSGPGHSGGIYNPVQYSATQSADYVHYNPQSSESSSQGGPAVVYYPTQYPNHNGESHAQIPVEQLTQVIQNYLLQQSAASGIHQSLASFTQPYQGSQDSYESVSVSETAPSQLSQHVGITIIRQPAAQDVPEHGGNGAPHAAPQIRHPSVQVSPGYNDNQQYVSIGVFPISLPGGDYGTDTQQYYNLVTPVTNNQYSQGNDDDYRNMKHQYQNMNEDYRNSKHQYQTINEDYRQTKEPYQNMNEDYRNMKQPHQKMNEDYRHNPEKPTPNDNTPTNGYQVISIDLSALRNQNAEQQRNPVYNQQPERPVEPPPQPQSYRQQNEKDTSYSGREKEFQQILIQIPHKILSDQSEKPVYGRGPNETPYTGTAQVANVVGNANKASNGPVGSINSPIYNGPTQGRPPPSTQHLERARHPKEALGLPQNGLLTNGINIAIIKQTESSNNAPFFKSSSDKRPQYHTPSVRTPHHQRPNLHRVPPPSFSREPHRPSFGSQNRPFPPNNIRFNQGPVVARTPYPIPVMRFNPRQNYAPHRSKPRLPNFVGHPGIFASSTLHYTTVSPDGSRPQIFGNAFPMPTQMPFLQASATKPNPQLVPGPGETPASSNPTFEAAIPPFPNSIPNGFGEINFDEINAFLNPNYDLFGSMTNGPDKKKVEDETKFLQKVTNDLLTHEMNVANLAGAVHPFGGGKPPANALGVPFPYKYWEQPIRNFGPPGSADGNGRPRLLKFYSHLQHPHIRGGKRFPTIGKETGRKRGLGKGYRGLKRKLSALRSSIRSKHKITPRLEETSEGSGNIETSVPKITSLIAGSETFGKISPRSSVIKTERPGLDGVSIPLNPEHILSSRISTDEDENVTSDPMPPIIVYKGFRPPVEIYGNKNDIEKVSKDNETEKAAGDKEAEIQESKESANEKPEAQGTQESAQTNSEEGIGYVDYMYSMLPDLIRSSLNRRYDGDSNKWLPVSPIEYALAEDSYDRNETTTEKSPTPAEVGGSVSEHTSSKSQASITENVEELFSLLGKEEKSDLDKA